MTMPLRCQCMISAMSKRPLRGTHRARNLALPFVVTAAAATVAACSAAPAQHPTNPPPPKQQNASGSAEMPPEADAGATEALASPDAMTREPIHTISKNPPAPRGPLPPLEQPSPVAAPPNGTVSLQRDGSCLWVETVAPMNCPTGMSCNPPPPKMMTVACPKTLPRKK